MNSTSLLLAQSPPTNWWFLGGILSAGLLAFAGAVILHVLAAAPGQRPSFRETFAWARNFLWALPVLAVTALVVGRAAPRFQDPTVSTSDPSEQIQIELNEPAGLNVEEPATDEPAEATKPESRKKKAVRVVKDVIGRVLPAKPGDEIHEPGVKPEIQSTSRLPEWISTPVSQDGDATLLVLTSKEHPTLADAEKEIAVRAAAKVRADFEKLHPTRVNWTVPADAVKFRLAFEEQIPRTAGSVNFTMHRVHRLLEISEETRDAAYHAWRGEVVKERLAGLGSVLGLFSLIVGASAVYLRLDSRTHGQYRTRLKAATVAAITAAGLLTTAIV